MSMFKERPGDPAGILKKIRQLQELDDPDPLALDAVFLAVSEYIKHAYAEELAAQSNPSVYKPSEGDRLKSVEVKFEPLCNNLDKDHDFKSCVKTIMENGETKTIQRRHFLGADFMKSDFERSWPLIGEVIRDEVLRFGKETTC